MSKSKSRSGSRVPSKRSVGPSELYGDAWKHEVAKLPKPEIIRLLASTGYERNALRAVVADYSKREARRKRLGITGMTVSDWMKLKSWFLDYLLYDADWKTAATAFTAGEARDAATAFESALVEAGASRRPNRPVDRRSESPNGEPAAGSPFGPSGC